MPKLLNLINKTFWKLVAIAMLHKTTLQKDPQIQMSYILSVFENQLAGIEGCG